MLIKNIIEYILTQYYRYLQDKNDRNSIKEIDRIFKDNTIIDIPTFLLARKTTYGITEENVKAILVDIKKGEREFIISTTINSICTNFIRLRVDKIDFLGYHKTTINDIVDEMKLI